MNKTLDRPGSDLPWLCIVNKKGPTYVVYLPVSCLKVWYIRQIVPAIRKVPMDKKVPMIKKVTVNKTL